MPTRIPADMMAGIDPSGIVTYLQVSGWRETGEYGRTHVWTRTVDGTEVEVLVPVNAQLRDYPNRLAELVGTLSTVEGRLATEVAQDLRSPRLDVQHIRMMPDGPSGSVPLHEGYLAIKGVNDLYLAAATTAVSADRPTVLPSRKPSQALGFLDQVRLGQTSRGSYVLRVEAPLPPPGITPPVSSRDVLLHLYQVTSAAHSAATESQQSMGLVDDLTPFVERVGDGVSANLCEAIVGIGGQRQNAFELTFRWAPAAPVSEVETPSIRFGRSLLAVVKKGGEYLRKLPVAQWATAMGRVVDLHQAPTDRLGRVVVEGVVEAGEQRHEGRVIMRLEPQHYDLAIEAHGSRNALRVSGQMRHTGRQFELSTVSRVEIVPPSAHRSG